MTLENRKTIVGVATGVTLFALVVHFFLRPDADSKGDKEEIVKPENIETAVTAYRSAIEKQEDEETLKSLNKQMLKEFGVSVSYNQDNKRYVVRDKKEKIIKTV